MSILETTLKNAKGEAFNSLLNAVKILDSGKWDFNNTMNNLDYVNELANIHSWLCSKYARFIKGSLDEVRPTQRDIFIEQYNKVYNDNLIDVDPEAGGW